MLALMWLAGAANGQALRGETGPAVAAGAATAEAATAEAARWFDIPAQPLVSALNSYAAVTGLAVFYDGALAAGRKSTAVQGVFTPEQALHKLLEGTRVAARSSDIGTLTLIEAPAAAVPGLEAVKRRAIGFMPYLALIQASLQAAMCRSAATRMDASEVVARFTIASSGLVARSELLTSTGSREHDDTYRRVLQGLDIGEPPPAGMPQPVTLLMLPRSAAECGQPAEPPR